MTDKIKHIALIALAGVAFTACSDSPEVPEANPEQFIVFSAPELNFSFEEGAPSRAEIVDDISEFTVWGYCIPNNVSGNQNKDQATAIWERKSQFFTSGPDVLNGFKVTVDGNNTSYDQKNPAGGASDPKPWYNNLTNQHPRYDDYNYGFIAASSPYGTFSMSNDSHAEKARPVLTFSLPHTSTNVATELDYTKQPDALIGTKFDQFANSKVRLSFQHIMTGLRFRFHNQCTATADDPKDLVVHRVTFSGEFFKSVKYSFENEISNDTITGDMYAGTFVLLDKDQTIAAGTSDLMRHDGDPNGRSVKLLLLPNPQADINNETPGDDDHWALGKNKRITIVYSINGGERKTFQTDRNFRLSYIPDANTLHTANFHFVGDEFIVTFQAANDAGDSNWENGSDSEHEFH